MSITGALVLFATLFFLVLFLLLPWGHRSQEEAGTVVPGTPAGAPDRPMLHMRRAGLADRPRNRRAFARPKNRRQSFAVRSGTAWNRSATRP